MSICSAYARYSDDRQNPASIEDQLRLCKKHAAECSWTLHPEYIYTDEDESGAGADRPGWSKLVSIINSGRCPIKILIVDDTSRLGRNVGEIYRFVEQAVFWGIRVVALSQGLDSGNKQWKMLFTMHGLKDDIFLEELGHKTHRGLEGRALKGLHTGGRCFGYDNVPEDTVKGAEGKSAVRLRINEDQAAVVIRIFEMAAEGGSLKSIAKTLNREHIPPPRKRSDRLNSSWCPSAIREMLRRELYVGRIVWNRRRFVKRPNTNKRLSRPRPESEWTPRIEAPELRIISDDLWQRVQERLKFVAARYGFGNRPGLAQRSATSSNLLTGFLKCGVCAANLTVVTGRGKAGHPRYGCPQNYNRGACSNRLKQRVDEIEAVLFNQLQVAVLRPEAIDYAVQEFERQLQSSLVGLDDRIGRIRLRAERLRAEIGNLAATAALCGPTPILVRDITCRQQALDGITDELLSAEPDSVSAEVGRIRQFVTAQLANIRNLLNADVQKAKGELERHVAAIRMIPQVEGKSGYYVAEGDWDLLGGYTDGVGSLATKRIRMDGCGGGI